MSVGNASRSSLLAVVFVACSPAPADDGGGGGGGSGTSVTMTITSSTAEHVDSSDSSDGTSASVDFACPGARWHEGNLRVDDATDLDALRDVGGVAGWLSVSGTSTITDLEFLSCLEVVQGGVSIYDNQGLEDVHGLERLRSIAGLSDGITPNQLSFANNPMLSRIGSLDALETLDVLVVGSNESLIELEMPALRQVGAILLGGYCRAGGPTPDQPLDTVGSYPVLEQVETFVVYGQHELVSLDSMIELADRGVVFGEVDFQYNWNLPQSEIEAFAMAAAIIPEACSNRDDMEDCPRCPGGE